MNKDNKAVETELKVVEVEATEVAEAPEVKRGLVNKLIVGAKKHGKKVAVITGGLLLVGIGFAVGKTVNNNNVGDDAADEGSDNDQDSDDDYDSESNTTEF